MDIFLRDLGLSIAWTLIGAILLFVTALAFDVLHPLKLRQLIEEGNVAAGLFLGAAVLGVAIIIHGVISVP